MRIQYNGKSKILIRLAELVNQKADAEDLEQTAADLQKEIDEKADKSAIPTVGDGVLSVQRNGKSVGTFSANAAENVSVNIPVPEKASELENDAGYGTYTKPSTGIPKSDLASGVQASLGKADTALQKHQDISGKQDKSTAVTHSANTAVGSTTKPVYIAANGSATPISHSINSDVPANAKFTDTTYNDATQSSHGLMTAADKKKLDGMDLTKYLPLSGGVMTGDIDLASNGVDLLVGSKRAANGTWATAVAGSAISTKQTFSSGLPERKSLVGSFLDQNGVWHSIISVRHRNGYTDGVNFGMYLRSLLTSNGNLIWNKQTGADKWQGERTLLDSINYSNYAAPLSHTHKNIDSIGNVGYYGSDKASTNGWYKFHSGTLTGYNDRTARLMLTYMYGYNNFGTIFFHARCNNGNTIQIQRLLWEVRSGFEDGDVVAVAKGNDYSLYVYNRNPQWGRIKIRVLESGGTSSDWDMTLASNFTKESTAPTPTIVASDGCTVANAKTLTGSGWVAMTVEGYAKSGTVKYRTYGKQITITGSVVLKNDIATSYPAQQYIASTTFDFSKIVGCSGVGRSSSGVGAYVTVENYNGDNLVCVYALGSKIAAGATLYFTITGFID